MSDKLYLNPDDLEVLLCISEGIDHQYAIQKKLRKAISTVHKRVERLKKLGYIQESYLGSRGKVTYSLTEFGKEFAHRELLRILRLLNDQLSKIYVKEEPREIPQVGLSPEAISGKLGIPLHITTKLLEKIYDTEVDGVVGRGMVDSNMVVIIDPKPTEKPTTPSASSSPSMTPSRKLLNSKEDITPELKGKFEEKPEGLPRFQTRKLWTEEMLDAFTLAQDLDLFNGDPDYMEALAYIFDRQAIRERERELTEASTLEELPSKTIVSRQLPTTPKSELNSMKMEHKVNHKVGSLEEMKRELERKMERLRREN